ncbi:Possible hydrolase or acyltransferase RutD in novel pyrimidine catabolism pathway [Sphingobium indicum BiD32]|uniref:Putative carbamate hydrolase RutD n=1 Tax=Sphingobium indicum BiD32 TaxID=1301087 RepID=N1MLX5_9SPHN|nr:pyrimidine utilization protein D [Sphingobium indicum]CCW16493.1 Possible hydrolase or acyltransferase RutD in novel pyrimidine catabolism pathway [Sphingobium indicum BiD32]
MAEAAGLYYETYGSADAPPLILSSGLGGSAGYWAPNIPALAEHFRVIAYDHRGTGRSNRALPEAITVEDMASDVTLLWDALGIERAHVIGHALGGAIGIETAIRTGRVDRLVVINGWRSLSPHTRRCFTARLALLHGAGERAFLEAQPLFLYPPDWIATRDGELTADLAHHLAAFPGVETTARRIAAVQAYAPDPAGLAALDNLLVIATRDDFLVPFATALDLAAPVGHAKIATFDWGGHACNVTDPDAFNRLVIEYLRR